MSTSFAIAVPDEDIALLHKKLELMSLPDELEDANWDYGAPLADVRRLATYWKDGFDWRKAEAALNADLPMFKRDIDVEGHGALNVHYVHKESDVTNAIPLLFIHGWPGSFIEIRKLMPQLVTPPKDSPAFHVVCLGLPGYGFSEAPRKKGFGPIQCAEVGHKLMLALGYEEYVAQGGDWGSRISRVIAAKYPKHAKAWHTNMPLAEPPRLSRNPLSYLTYLVIPYTLAERKDLEAARELRATGLGYNILQATKPQTIGYNIMDSPVGLLAWIYEKLVGWTDDYPWSDDEVLTWISIYWFSRAGPAASVRIYYEDRLSRDEQAKLPVTVPTGFSHFAGEIIHFPKTWTRALGKVVQEVYHDKGGHFAAYEVPELLADDLRKMFGRAGPAYRVVKNCSGYAEEP